MLPLLPPFRVRRLGSQADGLPSGQVMEKVVEYFQYWYRNRDKEDVPDMDIPAELCLELLVAADFLGLDSKQDAFSALHLVAVAHMSPAKNKVDFLAPTPEWGRPLPLDAVGGIGKRPCTTLRPRSTTTPWPWCHIANHAETLMLGVG